MQRVTKFKETLFPAHIIREAAENLFAKKDLETKMGHLLSLRIGKDEWTYDSIEQFLSSYQNQTGYTYFVLYEQGKEEKQKKQLLVSFSGRDTKIEVNAPTHGEISDK